jgi:hypothetical protein
MSDNMVVFTAIYNNVNSALADLDAVEQLHKDDAIGKYDAAVIDKEAGKAHIVKRMDRPKARLIPELVGKGTLPRKELHEAADELTSGEAGLIVVGEPTIEKGLDKALTRSLNTVRHDIDATTDELRSELIEAFKS